MATMTTTAPHAPAHRETPERTVRTVPPRVDIFETDKAFVVLADMPGVGSEGLDVEAVADTLVIRGHVRQPARPPDHQEFELANYQRLFTLTEDLDTDGITAVLRDGVLRVEIPKSPRLQPRKIPVTTE